MVWGFESRQNKLLLSSPVRPNRLSVQQGLIFSEQLLGGKWSECEGDCSPPSVVEVKNVWIYTSTPHICFHGVGGKDLCFYILPFAICGYLGVRNIHLLDYKSIIKILFIHQLIHQ